MIAKLHHFFFKKIDASTLSIFRVIVGLVMLYQVLYYNQLDYTFQFMTGPEFLFHYPYLNFLVVLSPVLLKFIMGGMAVAAICIVLGWFYRYATAFLFLGFSYFSFIDKTLYNNHLYLFALILFVMIFIEADRKYCVANPLSKKTKKTGNYIPNWNLFVLQFLLFITYFFGGIAKLKGDWISGRIPKVMVEGAEDSFLNKIFSTNFLTGLVNYGGIIYDLSIVFLLLYKPTRKMAIVAVLFFNIINGQILFNDIGVFPYFMILATVLFLDTEKIGDFISSNKTKTKKDKKVKKIKKTTSMAYLSEWTAAQKVISAFIVGFVIIQLLLPFRYLVYTDNPEWTGIGARFSWRMKMQTRKIDAFTMSVTDQQTGTVQQIDFQSFLSTNQYKNMINDPFAVVQFAKYLKEKAKTKGVESALIKANIMVQFNGHPSQLMLDPTVDLATVDENPSAHHSWIMPLKEVD